MSIAYLFGVRRQFRGHFYIYQNLWIGPFSHIYELLHIVLGSVDSFEGISCSRENSWIWSFLAVIRAIAFCFGVRRQFRGHFWHISKLVDLVLSRSYMSYSILFWDPSTVLRAFLAVVKTRGFGPFSQLYELLHIVLVSVDSFEGISGSHDDSWIWSFLAVI